MKDTVSERNGSTGNRCDSPSITNNNNHHRDMSSTAAALATAAFSGLHHSTASGLQLLGPGQIFAGHTAGLLNPLHLHATLASGPAMYPPHFGWHHANQDTISPPPMDSKTLRKNNNHLISSNNTISGKNQANSRIRRGPRKSELPESTTIEVAAMTNIAPSDPPSPARSGGSPPTNGNEVTNSNRNGNGDKTFTCGVCNRSFGYKHVLQNHERTHTGEKPFECPQCQKRFTRDHHLKTHMRLHTGEKPYHCTHCDRHFVQVANLRRHLRVHTGERPYACELCTSRFSDSNQLKAHMLIHKGEKPFQCLKCQGRFRRRHHLMHHKCPSRDIEEDQRNGKLKSLLIQSEMKNDIEVKDEIKDLQPINEDLDDEEDELEMDIDEEDEDILAESRDSGVVISHNNNSGKIRIRKPQEIRHVIRMQDSPRPPMISPIILTNPLDLSSTLPEQTEPEDLSMNTRNRNGYQNTSSSHSSGDSPLSHSPTSEELEEEENRIPPSLYLQHRHPKFRRHLQSGGIS